MTVGPNADIIGSYSTSYGARGSVVFVVKFPEASSEIDMEAPPTLVIYPWEELL